MKKKITAFKKELGRISIYTEPASRNARLEPSTVTVGISALRSRRHRRAGFCHTRSV